METIGEKTSLRKKMRKVRSSIHAGQCAGDEFALCSKLLTLPAVRNAKTICVYSSLGSELSLGAFIDEMYHKHRHIRLAFPAVLNNERMEFATVESGEKPKFVLQPNEPIADHSQEWISPQEIDVMLVPGVAFDEKGYRIGQGGGHYDRYIRRMNGNSLILGVAFNEQIIDEVPHEKHDIRVGYVITPSRIIAC